jgi:hypothetical protein
MVLWDYISGQSNNDAFKNCDWFFKVDTDAFLNLHVIEQFLRHYSHQEDHYVGWFGGIGGRKRHNQTINMAVGPFYGFSRSLMKKWQMWRKDNRFTWGHVDDHKGEDSQVGFFLREHGVCLDVPVVDISTFRQRAGMWEGFNLAHPLGPGYFRGECTKIIEDMVSNECFAYAHKVWALEWMLVLADVLKTHVSDKTRCELFGKGVSRIVNGTIYHRVQKESQCTITACDPCLEDAITKDCCGWEIAS